MKIVDRGGGTPIVVIPGAQGRWEWMKPAIDVLAQRCRVITFSLADEPSADAPLRPAARVLVLCGPGTRRTRCRRRRPCGDLRSVIWRADCRGVRCPVSGPCLVAGARFGAAAFVDARSTGAVLPAGAPASGAAVRHFVAAALFRDRSGQRGPWKCRECRPSPCLVRRRSYVVAAANGTTGSTPFLSRPSGGSCRCRAADACCHW